MKGVLGAFFCIIATASINVFSNELKEINTNYERSAERDSLDRSGMSPPSQKSAEIASGNGIKGQNYGFFGSFNYFFDKNHHGGDHDGEDHHHGGGDHEGGDHGDGGHHTPKPKPPPTHFPTAPPPRTTTPPGGIPFCPSPSSESTYYCLGSNTCRSDNDCYLAEMCCRTMLDRPTATGRVIGIPCCVSAFRPGILQRHGILQDE